MHHAKHFLMLEIASDIKYQCAKLFNHYLKRNRKESPWSRCFEKFICGFVCMCPTISFIVWLIFSCQIRILTKNLLPDLTRKTINLRKGSKTLASFKPQRSQVTDGSREKQKSVVQLPGPTLNFSLKKLEEKRKHENLCSLFLSFSGVTRSDPRSV